ncbi:MAG: right-handed parallel beta-helix repeat-containing protein, partial [Planctomycetes bacterium]|nr:right-handed parallel beta-helix repeat-containing protein [Planctomycetota bacterium]
SQQSGPVRTIARALALAKAGDRIVLAKTEEPYREAVGLGGPRNSGDFRDPLTIVGNGATLDGTQPVPLEAWEHFQEDVFRFRPREQGFQMLYRDGRPLAQVHVPREIVKLPALKVMQWCLLGGHVYIRLEKLKHPLDYKLSHTALQTGITLYGVTRVVISDLIVQGFRYDGISAADRAAEVRLSGVTLRGNGRSGLSVSGASQVRLEASLVGDNGQVQIRVEGPGQLRIEQSEVLDNTAPQLDRINGARVTITN